MTITRTRRDGRLDAFSPATRAFLYSIDPKTNPKFSKNIHEWLTKNARLVPKLEARYFMDSGVQRIYLGAVACSCHDDLTGSSLNEVSCAGKRATLGCFSSGWELLALPEFWPNYVAKGRCAIDPEHRRDYDERWSAVEASGGEEWRTCRWCHHTQRRERWIEHIPRERWVAMVTAP